MIRENIRHAPPALNVLYEDNHLLVLNKPARLPTMGTPGPAADAAEPGEGLRQA